MAAQSVRDLMVWQKAMDLTVEVYRSTRTWPRDELFGLIAQVRRAVVSVPANIAEGHDRTGPREFLHHLSIADGSLAEVETYLLLAQRLGYLAEDALPPFLDRINDVGRPLRGLIKSLR